ncbi:hypothetical protein SDC9_98919 [bioreactor metagenome]|uniref:ACT domain-containing protein n=1 Tax=bioreactor metagenome TaxID=1076179 RepID=A0A645AMT6_9ZZZZ
MNTIQQISTFVENRPGAFREILQVIQANNINIKALSIADTADFGILRFIVANPDQLGEILREAGFIVKRTPVLAITIGDKPGNLLTYVNKLSEAGINIEYVYAFTTAIENVAKVVMKVDDIERAVTTLSNDKEIKECLQAKENVDFYW